MGPGKSGKVSLALGAVLLGWLAEARVAPQMWHDSSPHQEGFAQSNGVRLQYLDWGGDGPALIFIHGLGDNPHLFDDLAPAFTDRFHVIAYARRGHGRSQIRSPYDTATLTEDLRGLMDQLGITRANLVGLSMGGNEITGMASRYPERVGKIVYLDAAYDWSDPDFSAAVRALPGHLTDMPAGALVSMDAYRSYAKSREYPTLDDMGRLEAYLRESVVVQSDGSVKPAMSPELMDAIFATVLTDRAREYTRVRAPALAIYAETKLELHLSDPQRRAEASTWERRYMAPFRRKSLEKVRRELANVQIVTVPGAHDSFFLTSRARVVGAIGQFLNQAKR